MDRMIYQLETPAVFKSGRQPIENAIKTVRRRIWLHQWLTLLGHFLLLTCFLAITLVLADRLLAMVIPWWAYGVAAVTPPLAAGGLAWWWRPSRHEVVVLIDHRLGLKDRLASALFASSIGDHPFAQHVVNEAQQAAMNLPLASAFPIRLARVWGHLLLGIVVLLALVQWMPEMDLMGFAQLHANTRAQNDRSAAIKQQLGQIEQTVSVIDPIDVGVSDLGTQDSGSHSMDLGDVLSEMNERDLTHPEGQRQAAIKLSQLQDRLDQQIQQQHDLIDTLRNVMSRLDPVEPGPGDQFVQTLGRGDFESTQEAFEELLRSVQSLPDQDRKAVQRQLEDLAEQLQEASEHFDQKVDQTRRQMKERLADAGTITKPTADERHHPSMESDVPSDDFSPQEANEQVEQLKQEQQNQERSKQMCQKLADGLDQASRAIGDPKSDHQTTNDESAEQTLERVSPLFSQMAQIRRQLEQMRQAQRQTRDAIDGLVRSPDGQEKPLATGKDPEEVENRIAPRRVAAGRQADRNGSPKIISWRSSEPNVPGQPTVGFDEAVTDAIQQAEQAVIEDRVPHHYHETIRQYFNQLPHAAGSSPSTPQ